MPEPQPLPILFVHHRSELGGAPTSLSHLIRQLDRTRWEPYVYCPDGLAAELFRSAGATVWTGPVASFTHIWASVYRGRRWLLFGREAAYLLPHLLELHRVLRRRPFAIVHLNDAPLVPAAVLARLHGIPIVWHLRSSLPFGGTDTRSRLVRRLVRWSAASSIAINGDVADSYATGSEVVPNSVELDRFHPGDTASARAGLGLDNNRPVVTFFGFLYPSKGFREFILAARRVKEQGIDAQYLMVGGAVRGSAFFRSPLGRVVRLLDLARDYEQEARALIDESGLADSIRLVPFTGDTSVIYRASDVVVAPSRGPELGRPVIEAAASGVPVVATGSATGGGVVVDGETGVLVPELTPEHLGDGILALIGDEERRARIGAAARLHAETHFDARLNAQAIERIYERLVTRPLPGRTPILYVHHRPQLGGAPSSLAHLIANLDARFEPHVYCPPGAAAELFAGAGATVHTGPTAIFAHSWDRPYRGLLWLLVAREALSLPGHLRQLDRLIRTHRFPIVHLNDSPLLPAAAVAHRAGARVVWHLRSSLAGEGRDGRSRAITTLMDRWGDGAIAIDSDVAARFQLRQPVQIVHNSVRFPEPGLTADVTAARERLGIPVGPVTVGFAGFLRRQKGWPELVEAARLLVARGVPVHFVIVGGGVRSPAWFRSPYGRAIKAAGILVDEESEITELVARYGLGGSFTFLPFAKDMREVYPALDVVTFPNQGVGLGRPVLEAAAHGKPVVAAGSADGAGVLLPGVTGLLLEHGSPAELADVLERLATDPELRARLGAAAGAHAHDAFDPERNARRVEAVYDGLLASSGGGGAAAAKPHQLPKASAGTTNGASPTLR
jgi:glycosyltransferase involved in cell wall biosynthesis